MGTNFNDNLILKDDPDYGFIYRKKLEYLLNYLSRAGSVPNDKAVVSCLQLLSNSESGAILKKLFDKAKALGMDLDSIKKEYSSGESSIQDTIEDILRKKSFVKIFYREAVSTLQSKYKLIQYKSSASPIQSRLQELHRLFDLDDSENEVLFLHHLYDSDEGFVDIADSCDEAFKIHKSRCSISSRSASILMGRPVAAIQKLYGSQSRIKKLHLLGSDDDIAPELQEYLAGRSSKPITQTYFIRDEARAVPLNKLNIASAEINMVSSLIRHNRGQGPLNILLYGSPGAGKTEFSRSLAHSLGLCLYSINNPEKDGDNGRDNFRFTALKACLNVADTSKSIILVDEADTMLETCGSFFSFTAQGDKGKVNTFLDDIKGTIIWVTNSWASMHESTQRRFDYSIHFDKPSIAQRQSVLQTQLEHKGLKHFLDKRQMEQIAQKFDLSAGALSYALRNAKMVHSNASTSEGFVESLNSLLTAHSNLIHGKGRLKNPSEANARSYSLQGLNIKGDIQRTLKSFRAFNKYWQQSNGSMEIKNMNLLLSGPPGSGKTEFARFLARHLKRRLVIKQASDLLDMYVGNSEKNIRKAFQQAEKDNAILFMDEADSLLSCRESAHRSWEVTQVNELLSCMESFQGIFICATNYKQHLDKASIRRFNYKLEMGYLKSRGILAFYRRLLGNLITTGISQHSRLRLKSIKALTPGDFKVVYQKHAFFEKGTLTHDILIEALEEEVNNKELKSLSKMGF